MTVLSCVHAGNLQQSQYMTHKTEQQQVKQTLRNQQTESTIHDMMSHVHSFECTRGNNPQYQYGMSFSGRGCIHAAASGTEALTPCQILVALASSKLAGTGCPDTQDTVSRLEGIPVLTDRLGHTQASQPLYSSKAVKATILHPSKGQGLAHVCAAKVVYACHPSLNVAPTHTLRQYLKTSHAHVSYAVTNQREGNNCLSNSRS